VFKPKILGGKRKEERVSAIPCSRRSSIQRCVSKTSHLWLALFHDLLLRSYLYHCVWSVI